MTMRKDEHAAVGNMYVDTYDVRVYQILKDVLYQTMYSIRTCQMNRFGSQLSQNCSQKLPDQLTTKFIHLIFIFSPNNRIGTDTLQQQTRL